MRSCRAGRLVALLALLTLWPAFALAQQPKAGVVTTLQGRAVIARPVLPQPVPLKFKDDVFRQDRIDTSENSVVRVLLGGKALVTIRELSTFTITEEPGRVVVDVQSGKGAVAVAKQLLRPGESVEIRTPNAIAAVRGSLITWTVGIILGQVSTQFTAHFPDPDKPVLVSTRAAPAVTSPLGDRQFIDVKGAGVAAALGALVNLTPAQAQAYVKEIHQADKEKGQTEKPPEFVAQLVKSEKVKEFGELAKYIGDVAFGQVPTGPPPGIDPAMFEGFKPNGDMVQFFPGGFSLAEFGEFPSTDFCLQNLSACAEIFLAARPNLIRNPSFETGDFANWTKTGAGRVISLFGSASLSPLLGSFMAFGHTGSGASTDPSICAFPCVEKTVLKQSFDVKSVLSINFAYILLTNAVSCPPAAPCALAGGGNDKWQVRLVPSSGSPVTLFDTTVTAELSAGNWVRAGATTDIDTSSPLDGINDFTLAASGGDTGDSGISDWTLESKTAVVSPGSTTLEFSVQDIDFSTQDSAGLLDAVFVFQDPPLYFFRDGSTFTRTDPAPLLQLTNNPQTFDSLIVVCCDSSAKLAGPLLRATNSDLTVPFSLVSVLQGGSLTTSSKDPLVLLEGGSHSLGSTVGVFDIAGVNTALDPASGLTLGTDRPLRTSGAFLEASGAAVTTRTALKLDTALLEATAPLLNLKAGSSLTTETHAVNLSLKAHLASVGPLVKLDGSSLNVKGALFNVNGSVLRGSGPLLSLSGGSTLNASLLANVLGSGQFNWAGPLALFSGSGNTINFSNSLCAANSCATVGGLRFALQNGAVSSNIAVTNSTPWVGQGTSGTVNLSSDGAHFLVKGSTSTVKISP